MRFIVIGEETIEPKGITRVIEYSVLVDELYGESGRLAGEDYGVRVRLTSGAGQPGFVDWENAETECAQVRGLTTKTASIYDFVDILRRGRVTPVSLCDTVADCLPL